MQLDTITISFVPPVGGWAGTRPAPTLGSLGLFSVGATLVVALATEEMLHKRGSRVKISSQDSNTSTTSDNNNRTRRNGLP